MSETGPDAPSAGDAAAGRIRRELAAAAGTARSPSVGEDAGSPERCETVYRPGGPLDVHRTLSPLHRGDSNPCFRIDRAAGDVWLAMRTTRGPATLVVRPVREGARAVAFGPGAEAAVESVPELLGRGDDWGGLHRLLQRPGTPEWLRATARRHPGLRLCRTGTVLDQLAPAILEQRVTGLEAHRAIAALHRQFAQPAPGPASIVPRGLLLPLTGPEWLRIPSWRWHRSGADAARARTVLRAAERAAALERLARLPRTEGAEARRRLCALPGVGAWTAAETVQRALGDPDAPSFGDYHLPGMVGWAFTGRETDDEGMRELLAAWPGHRQRIVRLVLLSGRLRPRRGPRLAVEDHRDR